MEELIIAPHKNHFGSSVSTVGLTKLYIQRMNTQKKIQNFTDSTVAKQVNNLFL